MYSVLRTYCVLLRLLRYSPLKYIAKPRLCDVGDSAGTKPNADIAHGGNHDGKRTRVGGRRRRSELKLRAKSAQNCKYCRGSCSISLNLVLRQHYLYTGSTSIEFRPGRCYQRQLLPGNNPWPHAASNTEHNQVPGAQYRQLLPASTRRLSLTWEAKLVGLLTGQSFVPIETLFTSLPASYFCNSIVSIQLNRA